MQVATAIPRPNRGTGQRVTTAEMEDRVHVSLPGGPEAAGQARDELHQLDSLRGAMLDNLRLLVTELVTNSVRHAGARNVDLTVLAGLDAVRVEVSDDGPGFTPRPRGSDDDREGGWGLFLVQRLASRWGVLAGEDQTRVWCELDR